MVLRGAAALPQQRQQQQEVVGDAVDLTRGGSASPGSSPGRSDAYAATPPGGFAPPAAAAGDEGERVLLKLRSSRGEMEMRMLRGDPFSKLFARYRWARALPCRRLLQHPCMFPDGRLRSL